MNKALARLRAKTDRELSILAQKQLEQTLKLAQAGHNQEAARGYKAAQRILSVTNVSLLNRNRIEELVAGVESALQIDRPVSAVA